MNGDYIKPSDVAKRLGVTRGAVYKWIREGKLKAVRFGENAVRIPRAELEAFERRSAGVDKPGMSDLQSTEESLNPSLAAGLTANLAGVQ